MPVTTNSAITFYLSMLCKVLASTSPGDNNMFKVNSRNTKTKCEIWSKLTIVNFEHISHLVLGFLLLTLSR